MSVSADPPTLLVAINRGAGRHPLLSGESLFCVNLLADRHRELVGIFSGQKKGLERFQTGNWMAGPQGLPVLPMHSPASCAARPRPSSSHPRSLRRGGRAGGQPWWHRAAGMGRWRLRQRGAI